MLNLEPLGLRRLRFDLVMYYKILHVLMSVDSFSHLTHIVIKILLSANFFS
jgi:hypothetical protein